MPLVVNITISGSKNVIKALQRFEGDLNDWTKEMNSIGDYLMDVYGRQAFDTEGAVFGDRWADLSPIYELWKAKVYAGRGILERSGRLRGGFVKNAGKTDLEIKNTVAYGVYHQSTAPRRKIPRRPFIGMTPTIEKKVIGFFVDGITGKIRRAFT